MAKQRKGALLFSLRVPFTWKRAMVALVAALAITDKLYSVFTTPERGFRLAFSLAMVVVWSAVLVAVVFRRTLRLYEEGVSFPSSSWGDTRFLRWEQLERYYWHDGVLGLVGISQPLTGRPVRGGEARVPLDMWPQVEAILKRKQVP
jgi:hypothetical protein